MEEMNQKKKTTRTWLHILIVALIVILAIAWPYLGQLKWWEEEKYCRFENTVSDELSRDECIIMKIVSKDVDRVNFDNFKTNITYSCYDDYENVPQCSGDNFYFADYSLSLFTEKDIEGYICIAYNINYHDENNTRIGDYEKLIAELKFDNQDNLTKQLIECDGGI